MELDYSLIQPHTIEIYNLNNKVCQLKTIPARKLLVGERFDLFAKLFYIKKRKSNPLQATQVYAEHIKAFNPDLKEPGRDDKNSVEDFTSVFDQLIDTFEHGEFDSTVSIVPIDSRGVILDGAHRVAALAFYDKQVTVAQFDDVQSRGRFDYDYFKFRGLKNSVLDIVALDMTYWLPDIKVACLWPSVKDKTQAVNLLGNFAHPVYELEMKFSLKQMEKFVGEIYSHQPWTKNFDSVKDKAIKCYGRNNIKFVLFETTDDEGLLNVKARIRDLYGIGNHSIHITDNQHETEQIMQWLAANKDECARPLLSEHWEYFKRVHWINFKVQIAKLLNRLKDK